MKMFKVWFSGLLGKNARSGFSKCVVQLQGANRMLMKEKTVLESKMLQMKAETVDYQVQIDSNAQIADAVKKIADALDIK